MKARALLLVAVAAIAIAEADQNTDTMNRINALRAQQAKWMDMLRGKSGYVMNTKSGKHFVSHDETVSQKVCDGKTEKKHLLGQDEASLPPQFRGLHNKRNRRAVPQMVGQDLASLPPSYLPVSHSISDVFDVLKNALKTSCVMTIQYHHRMGYPMHVNVTSCKKFPTLVRHIRLPTVTLVARSIHMAGKVCSKPQALKHAASKVLVQHFEALAALSPPKVEISAATKKALATFAELTRTHSIGPVRMSPQEIMGKVKAAADALAAQVGKKAGHTSPQEIMDKVKATADALAAKAGKEVKKAPVPIFLPGPVVLPADAAVPAKQHAPAKEGMMTGDNPAVFTDVSEDDNEDGEDLEHHRGKHPRRKCPCPPKRRGKCPPCPPHHGPHGPPRPPHHGRQTRHPGPRPTRRPRPGPHSKPHHVGHDGHHDHHHGGDDSWMFAEDSSRFSQFWHSKAHQFRHFVMKHPWVLPTSFAILGLITSAIILIAVHYARKRRAARNQDGGHTLLINEDKKALVDNEDDQPASVYVNQVSA